MAGGLLKGDVLRLEGGLSSWFYSVDRRHWDALLKVSPPIRPHTVSLFVPKSK